ncbi:efflux RND transporter periplasmic adaptor subunit [Candidatus Gottesmanbacteria bacterium]|nr:efflux RND transporter periplasmic adaptor subunit [Candidatus Gottesmanbacteria bacterium]
MKKIPRLLLIGLVLLLLASGWFIRTKFIASQASKEMIQTGSIERGTLIVSLSASGQVSSANSAPVTTQASGVVSKVFVKNDEIVKVGTPLVEIDLDLTGRQKSAQAYANYQSAKNSLDSSKASYYSLQSDMLTKWKTYMDIAQGGTYQNADGSAKKDARALPQFMSTSDDWLSTEAKYKNQEGVVKQAESALSSAWISYQQSSPTVYAPISGKVTGLSLQIGGVLSPSETSTKIASIKTDAYPTVSRNLSEIDVSKVSVGNKATLTLDALPGKTYTGTIVSVDTVGIITSGVTTYSVVIRLDTAATEIYSNMAVSAKIITNTKDSVLIVPATAVKTQNGLSIVRLIKNGKQVEASVEIGISSDTSVEIVSGINEGDTIITSSIVSTSTTQRTAAGTSPFSVVGGGLFRGAGGGGAARGR